MEPKGETKLDGVTMAMGALDCPICYEPLVPPIYQCGVGHLICNSCCIRLNKCPLCPRSAFERCFGMERVVESIEVPCCFAENGCAKKITYFNKKKHEKVCRHGPCFCPEPGCGFSGPAATLPDHFTDCHMWPNTAFKYYTQFGLRLQPGPHVLRAQDGTVFLMNVVAAEPLGHAISLVCVRPATGSSRFGCSLVFSCFTGHHQISTLDPVRCSTLADGLPKDGFCIVPKASGGVHDVVLKTNIYEVRRYDIELGDEDDEDEDESYDEEL
ncbi:putative E3 ubiquitin-protein ligase SINA-like 6 [Miscanthus floridulus]|uniref:putative E3 ubiquitin-protein ligase SINA-like 6 n=1 Tax=Miscanthus floridulus TaxID=154761 RepID=UPI00345831C1